MTTEKKVQKEELLQLVAAAYDEGVFNKNKTEIASSSVNATKEIAFTFRLRDVGTEKAKRLFELAKRLGV